MPQTFDKTLVVGVSSRALFELSESDRIFNDEGIGAYRRFMLQFENEPLEPGTAFPLVCSLLKLNELVLPPDPPLVEVIVMSRNSPETGVRIMKSLRERNIASIRSAFTGGESLASYIEAFGIDLFLSKSHEDVQRIVDTGTCAAALLYPPPEGYEPPTDQVRIAFDADAVLFDESSEAIFRHAGIDGFHENEDRSKDEPMPEGPFALFIKKLSMMQNRLPEPVEYSPIRMAVVTARSAPAELRVLATLRRWGVYVDAAFFLGGLAKEPILKAFRPHIFFDDQDAHVLPASRTVPSGRVPWKTSSSLQESVTKPSEDNKERIEHQRSPADTP